MIEAYFLGAFKNTFDAGYVFQILISAIENITSCPES